VKRWSGGGAPFTEAALLKAWVVQGPAELF
jgi:hypothetical protein